MTKYVLFLIVPVFFLYGTANADFYKWEDENGNVHITDYPPPAKSGKKVKVHKYDPDSSSTTRNEEEQGTATGSKAIKKPGVILYTKNSCLDCDKAREFLTTKNIKFTEYNIDENKAAAKKRKEIDDSDDVPFAIIDNNHIYGFSENGYNRVLKLKP